MKRIWRVRAFGSFWDSPSLFSALVLVQSLHLDYGPRLRVSMVSYLAESVVANPGPFQERFVTVTIAPDTSRLMKALKGDNHAV